MILNFRDWARPRFSFRETRKRAPMVGKISVFEESPFLLEVLDSEASDPLFSSWFLSRYQKILPKRVTRLTVREQRQLADHTKRMRHLLILNNQNTPTQPATLRRKKTESGASSERKRRPNANAAKKLQSTFSF